MNERKKKKEIVAAMMRYRGLSSLFSMLSMTFPIHNRKQFGEGFSPSPRLLPLDAFTEKEEALIIA